MALLGHSGSVAAPTTGTTPVAQTVDLSGTFSATEPLRFVFFEVTRATAAGLFNGHASVARGVITRPPVATGEQGYTAFLDEDAAGTSDVANGVNVTATLKLFSDATGPATEAIATLGSTTDTGFTLNWTDLPPGAYLVSYWALGGSHITDVDVFNETSITAGTTQTVELRAGFGAPDLVLTMMPGTSTSLADAASTAFMHVGFAAPIGDSAVQQAMGQSRSFDNMATSATEFYTRTTGFLLHPDASNHAALANRSTWPTDAFNVVWAAVPSSARMFIGAAFKFAAGTEVTIGKATAATATGAQDIAAGTVAPSAALFVGGASAAEGTSGTDMGGLWTGHWDGTRQRSVGVVSLDGSNTTSTGYWRNETQAVQFAKPVAAGTNPPVKTSSATASVSGTNLRLTWDVADSLARPFLYLLLAAAPVGQALEQSIADTATLTDAATAAADTTQVDTLAVTDTAAHEARIAPTDTVTTTDQANTAPAVHAADTATVTDTARGDVTTAHPDTVTVADTTATQGTVERELADTATVTDTTTVELAKVLEDTATLADEARYNITTAVTDAVAASDQATPTLGGVALEQSAADTAGVADTASTAAGITPTDTVTVTDLVAHAVNAIVADTAAATDTVARAVTAGAQDTLATVDNATLQLAGVALEQALTDIAAVADTVAGLAITAGVRDTATVGDTTATAAILERAILDALTITDTLAIDLGGQGIGTITPARPGTITHAAAGVIARQAAGIINAAVVGTRNPSPPGGTL